MNRAQRAAATAAIVVVGTTLGFFSYRQLQQSRTTLRAAPAATLAGTGSTGTSGGSDSDGTDEAAVPAHAPVPETIPEVKLHDLAGTVKSLRDFSGRPLIINFWASWCAPCRREIPLLGALRRRYAADQLEIVGIAIDTRLAVTDFLRSTRIDYPLLVGEEDGATAVEKFGMEPVLPFSVFADARGNIITVKIGELHGDEADYILTTMRALAAGKTTVPDARRSIAGRLREFAVARSRQTTAGGTISN